eukprot:TRINITY_DN8892_c0_g1_i3.p3 TRINITY_DN8892_c0_g1~~TRINITY_DN8892_c0_g1_i3.p3  ORF type:complete len:118 (+),score=23.98 TRINITY_DN8892_c0_g1_i3:179-532(+)
MRRRSRHSLACAALLVVLLACSSLCELNLFVEQQLPRSRSHPSRLFATARAAGAEDAGEVGKRGWAEALVTKANDVIREHTPEWCKHCNPANGGTGHRNPKDLPAAFVKSFVDKFDA